MPHRDGSIYAPWLRAQDHTVTSPHVPTWDKRDFGTSMHPRRVPMGKQPTRRVRVVDFEKRSFWAVGCKCPHVRMWGTRFSLHPLTEHSHGPKGPHTHARVRTESFEIRRPSTEGALGMRRASRDARAVMGSRSLFFN